MEYQRSNFFGKTVFAHFTSQHSGMRENDLYHERFGKNLDGIFINWKIQRNIEQAIRNYQKSHEMSKCPQAVSNIYMKINMSSLIYYGLNIWDPT